MNCDKFNECLDNYENLSDETKQKMDKHALECANCKSELEFMRSIISTAKSLPDINVPVDFMEKLNVRIDEEEKKKARITRRVMRNVRRDRGIRRCSSHHVRDDAHAEMMTVLFKRKQS